MTNVLEYAVEPTTTTKAEELSNIPVVPGDVDGDGELTMKDVLNVRKFIAGMGRCDHFDAADFDGDGEITMKDVLLIRKKIAGWD